MARKKLLEIGQRTVNLGLRRRTPHGQSGAVRGYRKIVRRTGELRQTCAQLVDLVLQFQDPFDAHEVDAVLLGQALHFAQPVNVAWRVTATAAGGTARRHQAEPVVLPEGLRMHPGHLGGDRDDVDGVVVTDPAGGSGQGHDETGAGFHGQDPFASRSRLARTSVPEVVVCSFSSACLVSSSSDSGTITSTVASRSPLVPSFRVAPRPRIRNVRPLGVPGGIRSVTGIPFSVGTLISAPSDASGKVTGTVTVRCSSLRPNTGCPSTCTVT